MNVNKSTILTSEILVIVIYSFIIIFSLTIQPINLILGIICVLFIPGYNLIAILKPKFSFIQKIGYMTIFSLAIGNILMFFNYIFVFDIVSPNGANTFFFYPIFIIITIQIFNLILIAINYKTSIKIKTNHDFITFKRITKIIDTEKSLNIKNLLIYLCFIISLILMAISTYYSRIPSDNSIQVNMVDYKRIFTFFVRVPPIFFFFLIVSILCLAYLIFKVKNHIAILICVSLFLYILWILPYLQIKNYISGDSYFLSVLVKDYQHFGIKPFKEYSFSLFYSDINSYKPQRYVTSFFTSSLLIFATGMSTDFVLWFIFPLSYVFISFFIYCTFQNFKSKKDSNNLALILLTILAVLTPQFVKFAHSASTGVIGTFIFFILIVEFYDCFTKRNFDLKAKDLFIIIFLFLFLCLTHTEECIYFIFSISLFGIYYIFAYLKNKRGDIDNLIHFKKTILKFGILICTLLLIFYITQEFFGWISPYMSLFLPDSILTDIYENTKVLAIPSLNGTFTINYFVLILIVCSTFSIFYLIHFILTRYFELILKIYIYILNIFKKIFKISKRQISRKIFPFLTVSFIYLIIFLLNLIYFQNQVQNIGYLILDIILSFAMLIFHISVFFKGVLYYKIGKNKQNFFIFSLIPPILLIILLFLAGNFEESFYILNARYVSFFVFFNLIITQNSYFKHLELNNHKILYIFTVLSFLSATYYSLRLLRFG